MVDPAKLRLPLSPQEKLVLTHNQFFVLITGAWLGVVFCIPAVVLAFPGSWGVLAILGLSGVLLLPLAVLSWFSDRPRQLSLQVLRSLWERVWLCYLAAAIWLVAAFWFLVRFQPAFQTPRFTSYIALLGFGLWATAGLAICLGPTLLPGRALLNQRGARLLSLLLVVGWFGFGFYLWGENLGAWWWIIDDHEIVNLIGDGLSPFQVWDRFASSAVLGQVIPFAGLRFRPMFWIFQYLEGAFWGAQPMLWYFFRMSVFILVCVVCYRLLKPLLGTLNSVLFTLVLATFSFWGDIFTRLGPAENYALLGVTGYALAYVALLRHYRVDPPSPSRWVYAYWILLGASAVIAMGAKENFMWLLLPNAALFGYLIVKRQFSIVGFLVLALSTGFGMLSLATVFLANTTTGIDTYGNSARLSDRLGNTLGAFQRNIVGLPALAALGGVLLVLAIGAIILYRAGDRAGLARLGGGVLIGALVAGGLAAVYVSQLYFYNGELPTNSRYDLPALLIPSFVGLIGVLLILLTLQLTIKQPFYVALAKMAFTLSLAAIVIVTGFTAARSASHANFERTRLFRAELAKIESVAKTNPQVALVLDTHAGWDYEASVSVVRFLRHSGVENPIFLRYTNDERLDSNIPLQKRLEQTLTELSQGIQTSGLYEPYQRFAGGRCFGIGFSGESAPPCEPVTRIWQ